MISLVDVSGGYHGVSVVRGVNLSFETGCITTLIGPNGCGKSTLLRMAAGLQCPYAGKVTCDGKELSSFSRQELARRIAYLPQQRNIAETTVHTLVLHGRFPYLGYPRHYAPSDYAAVEEAMAQTGITALRHKRVDTLSGGERQKVYVAMAVAQGTDTIFLDEPTTYLDIRHQLDIMTLAGTLKESGKAVVMVLHDLNAALTCSDRIGVIHNGGLAFFGSPEDAVLSGVVDRAFGVVTHKVTLDGVGSQYCFTVQPQVSPK